MQSTAAPTARVARVEWEGLDALTRAEVERVTELRAPSIVPWRSGSWLDEETLADDTDRLRDLYRRRGYYSASVESVVEPVDDDPGRVRVRYRIVEGPRVRIRRFELAAPDGQEIPADVATPLEALTGDVLPVGAPLELATYRAAKQRVVSELGARGYLAAELEAGADIDAERRYADLAWWLEPGPRVLAGETRILGLEQVSPELVRREVEWTAGEPLTSDELAGTQRRLIESGLFRSVVIEPRPVPGESPRAATALGATTGPGAATAVWPIEVRVTERRPRTVEVSAGFGTDDRARGRVSWQHRNLGANGTQLEASARASSLVREVASRITFPGGRFASHRELRASVLREYDAAFDATHTQLGAAIDWKLRSGFTARAVFDLDAIRTTDVADETDAELDGTEGSSFITTLGFALDRSTALPVASPVGGSRLEMRTEVSTGLLGSEVDFALAEADLRRYWSLGSTVLAARLRAGVIQPFGTFEPEDVPLPRRFYAGGGDSVRGFDFQKLGPLDAADNPLGGLSVLTASAELRVPLWERIGGVVFADTGVLETRPLHFPTRELRYAVGFGLRVDTPVGPLRADLGHLLNPPRDFQRFRLHLSIGHAF